MSAQSVRPVLSVLPFDYQGVGEDETKTIEKLVQSYISEFDVFRLIATSDRDRILSEREFAISVQSDPSSLSAIGDLLSADYLLNGSVGAVGDNRVITLSVIKVKTGEKKSLSSVHRSISELALGTRDLVARLFERGEEVSAELPAEESQSVIPTETDIIGNWRGDKGVEAIKILRGGRAFALLSSNAQMELSYTIVGTEIRFTQNSPNTILFYHPVPYKIAAQLVDIAKPMEWRFQLAAKGMVLRGTKSSSAVRYDQDRIIEVMHGASREAEWTRLSS